MILWFYDSCNKTAFPRECNQEGRCGQHWLFSGDTLSWVGTWTAWMQWDYERRKSRALCLCFIFQSIFNCPECLLTSWEGEHTRLGARKYLQISSLIPLCLGRQKSFPLLEHRFNCNPKESWPKDLAIVLKTQGEVTWLLIGMKARLDYHDALLWSAKLSVII